MTRPGYKTSEEYKVQAAKQKRQRYAEFKENFVGPPKRPRAATDRTLAGRAATARKRRAKFKAEFVGPPKPKKSALLSAQGKPEKDTLTHSLQWRQGLELQQVWLTAAANHHHGASYDRGVGGADSSAAAA